MEIKNEHVFKSVDESGVAPELIEYLERVAARPDIREMHELADRLLMARPGERILEAGCGLGATARDLARATAPDGEVIAVDVSEAMIAAARERHDEGLAVTYDVGDVTALDLPDASVDAVRIERVLQHLVEVDQAIAEIFRVLRPGGRVVVLDPDWGSVAVDMEDPALAETVRAHFLGRAVRPRVGIELRRRLRRAGFASVEVLPHVFSYTSLADVAEVLPMFNEALPPEARLVPDGSREEWFAALRRADEAGELFVGFTGYVARGSKP